jgi:nucleotide-binding universal stress UspA family protein
MVTSAEVAFDGGRGGQAALVWAASSVADRPATVITVEEADDLGVRIPEGPTADELRDAADDWLRHNAPEWDAHAVVERGDVAEVLQRRSAQAGLMVLGSRHGASAGGRLGRVARRVAETAEGTVILVPAAHPIPGGPVVVGVAEGESSGAPLEVAADLAERLGRPLRVVHAWWVVPHSDSDGLGPDGGGQARRDHLAVVDTALAQVRERHPGLIVSGDAVVGDAIDVLMAASADCSLMVVGRKRSGVLAEWLLGTVTHDLISRLPCPVAVVPTAPVRA